MWESPHLRFPRTVGRGGGRTVSLSCLPRFPSDRHFHRCFFCKSLKIDPNSLSQIQNTGTEPDRCQSRARFDSATKLRSSSVSALAISHQPRIIPDERRVCQYEFSLRREAIPLCDNFRSGCRRVRYLPGFSPSVEHLRSPNRWHALASRPP